MDEVVALLPIKINDFNIAVDEYMLDKKMGVEMNGKLVKLQETFISKVKDTISDLEETLKLLNMDTIEERVNEVFSYISSAAKIVEEQHRILIL